MEQVNSKFIFVVFLQSEFKIPEHYMLNLISLHFEGLNKPAHQ